MRLFLWYRLRRRPLGRFRLVQPSFHLRGERSITEHFKGKTQASKKAGLLFHLTSHIAERLPQRRRSGNTTAKRIPPWPATGEPSSRWMKSNDAVRADCMANDGMEFRLVLLRLRVSFVSTVICFVLFCLLKVKG